MVEEQDDVDETFISISVEKRDQVALLGHLAFSLYKIAVAQQRLVELAEKDLDAQVQEAVEGLAEKRAEEIVDEKTKRSFIGRK